MPRPKHPAALLALLLGLIAAGPGAAQTSPYYIGVNQAFSYDSNIYRLPDAFAEGSWWSSTSLVAGFDQSYGRQRFYANGNVAANVYGQLSDLNNTSYGLTAGWDWATVERLSGKLYASYSQNLANYGGFYQATTREKNIQDSALLYGTVEYGLVSLLAADARIAYSSVHYSAQRYAQYELDQASVSARVRKQFSGQLTMGTGLAYTRGDYFAIGQQFDRYDVFVTGDWLATGQSTVSGRLGYSWLDYTGFNPSKNDGLTGWLQWRYTPTGKLTFTTLLSYDTSANSTFTPVGGGTPGGLGETKWLTAGLQFTANYAFSAKTSFNASLQYYSQKRDFAFTTPGGVVIDGEARNRLTNLSLGATWLPSRNWQVACNAYLNDRNEYSPQPITLLPYSAWGSSCSIQFVFQ